MKRSSKTLATVAALVMQGAAVAQELNWDLMIRKGMDTVDRQLDAYGYELDRDALSAIPRYEDLVKFWTSIEGALEGGSFEDLAWLRPEVEASLAYLEGLPAAAPYADWLRQQLDYFAVAEEATIAVPEATHRPPPPPDRPARPLALPSPPPAPAPPAVRKQVAQKAADPEAWKRRMAGRPKPARADELVPQLKRIFRAEGVPEELVWLAEVESTMDPLARNPVGAAGLFQFMPPTAQRFGLSTERPDERLQPDKSARAAAQYLRFLHRQFRSWPLALAGYNAGEGRVGRLLKKSGAQTFEAIADELPAETRMYVPKLAAVLELREGVQLHDLPAPRS